MARDVPSIVLFLLIAFPSTMHIVPHSEFTYRYYLHSYELSERYRRCLLTFTNRPAPGAKINYNQYVFPHVNLT